MIEVGFVVLLPQDLIVRPYGATKTKAGDWYFMSTAMQGGSVRLVKSQITSGMLAEIPAEQTKAA